MILVLINLTFQSFLMSNISNKLKTSPESRENQTIDQSINGQLWYITAKSIAETRENILHFIPKEKKKIQENNLEKKKSSKKEKWKLLHFPEQENKRESIYTYEWEKVDYIINKDWTYSLSKNWNILDIACTTTEELIEINQLAIDLIKKNKKNKRYYSSDWYVWLNEHEPVIWLYTDWFFKHNCHLKQQDLVSILWNWANNQSMYSLSLFLTKTAA